MEALPSESTLSLARAGFILASGVLVAFLVGMLAPRLAAAFYGAAVVADANGPCKEKLGRLAVQEPVSYRADCIAGSWCNLCRRVRGPAMKKQVSSTVVILVIVIVVLLVAFYGYKTVSGKKAGGGEGDLLSPEQQRQMMPATGGGPPPQGGRQGPGR